MKCNMGNSDRVIRASIGGFLVTTAFVTGIPWFHLGWILVATSAIKWCPIYLPMGWSTQDKD